MQVTRYRRDISSRRAEIVEEKWETIEVGNRKGLRLVDTGLSEWIAPLEPHEKKCIEEGWEPPMAFSYLDKLPPNAVRMPT